MFKIEPNDIVVCAIAKNENDYVEEWVKWYFGLGFDKIFIYDDNADRNSLPSIPYIKEMVNAGKIGIEYCGSEKIGFKQMKKYEKFYKNNKFAWCAFFDLDEFLVLKQHNNIRDYLNSPMFKNFNTILVCWEFYGDNEKLYKEPGNVMDRFPESSKIGSNNSKSMVVKTITRGGYKNCKFSHPHTIKYDGVSYCNERGDRIKYGSTTNKTYEYAKLNHYFTKSTEEFVNKVKRGRAAGQRYGMKRKINDYYMINVKTTEKDKILNSLH